jgi:hypothetical protein
LLSTTTGPNGKRCIVADGIDDFLAKASAVFDFPCTVYVVLRQKTFTNSDYIYDTRGGGVRAGMVQRASAGALRGPSDSPIVTQTLNTWNVISQEMSASVNRLRIDGGTWQTGTAAASAGSFSLTLFANNVGVSSWADVDIAAMVAYSRILTSGEHAQVLNFLQVAFGP